MLIIIVILNEFEILIVMIVFNVCGVKFEFNKVCIFVDVVYIVCDWVDVLVNLFYLKIFVVLV